MIYFTFSCPCHIVRNTASHAANDFAGWTRRLNKEICIN